MTHQCELRLKLRCSLAAGHGATVHVGWHLISGVIWNSNEDPPRVKYKINFHNNLSFYRSAVCSPGAWLSLFNYGFKFQNASLQSSTFPFPSRRKPPQRRKLKGSIASPLSSIRDSMAGSRFRLIKEVLGFFESVLVGCFFGCFRVKDDARRKSNASAKTSLPEEQVRVFLYSNLSRIMFCYCTWDFVIVY